MWSSATVGFCINVWLYSFWFILPSGWLIILLVGGIIKFPRTVWMKFSFQQKIPYTTNIYPYHIFLYPIFELHKFSRSSRAAALAWWWCSTAITPSLWLFSRGIHFNTLRPRQDGRHFADNILRAFSSMNIVAFWLNLHWNMFARVQLTIIQHWFR